MFCFAQTKYSSHMHYFNDVFTTFLGFQSGSYLADKGQKALRFH